MLGLISNLLDYHPLLSSGRGSDLLLGPGVEVFPRQDPSLAEHVQYQRAILKPKYNGYDAVLCCLYVAWCGRGVSWGSKNPSFLRALAGINVLPP